jgi:phospholipid/cholesterol/gamma-HCH transport system ATP-binding protein
MKMQQETIMPLVNEKDRQPVISIRHLSKSFGLNVVLSDFNLALNKGENVAVLGKSGSGKSVLIKCIIGLLKPDNGEINVLDRMLQSSVTMNWIESV